MSAAILFMIDFITWTLGGGNKSRDDEPVAEAGDRREDAGGEMLLLRAETAAGCFASQSTLLFPHFGKKKPVTHGF